MKNKYESELERILHYYGSIEAYNEEQRRFGLVSIEVALRENPFIEERGFAKPTPKDEGKKMSKPRPRRFRPWFLGNKPSSEQI